MDMLEEILIDIPIRSTTIGDCATPNSPSADRVLILFDLWKCRKRNPEQKCKIYSENHFLNLLLAKTLPFIITIRSWDSGFVNDLVRRTQITWKLNETKIIQNSQTLERQLILTHNDILKYRRDTEYDKYMYFNLNKHSIFKQSVKALNSKGYGFPILSVFSNWNINYSVSVTR